jgi:hypothetical protein
MRISRLSPRIHPYLGLRFLILVGLCKLLSFLPALATNAPDWQDIYAKTTESLPILIHNGGLCAGGLIAPDRILTAAHCVSALKEVSVQWHNSSTRELAHVVSLDLQNDLAVLRLEHASSRPVLAILENDAHIRPGDEIATIGHPFGISLFSRSGLNSELNFILSRGIISKINATSIITDMSISPGNSGGPALNGKGEIIGIVSRKEIQFGVGNVGYLSPPRQIRELVANSRDNPALPFWKAKGFPIVGLGLFAETGPSHQETSKGYEVQLGYSFFSRVGLVCGFNTADFGRLSYGNGIALSGKDYRYRYLELSAGDTLLELNPFWVLNAAVSLQWRTSIRPGNAKQESLLAGGKLTFLAPLSLSVNFDIANPKVMSALISVNAFSLFFH